MQYCVTDTHTNYIYTTHTNKIESAGHINDYFATNSNIRTIINQTKKQLIKKTAPLQKSKTCTNTPNTSEYIQYVKNVNTYTSTSIHIK